MSGTHSGINFFPRNTTGPSIHPDHAIIFTTGNFGRVYQMTPVGEKTSKRENMKENDGGKWK
jgi:hypothetical protein